MHGAERLAKLCLAIRADRAGGVLKRHDILNDRLRVFGRAAHDVHNRIAGTQPCRLLRIDGR